MRTAAGTFSTLLALAALSAAPRGSVGQRNGGGGGGNVADISDDNADNVYCEEDGSSAHYDEILSGSGSTMIRYGASDSGCSNHVNWALNPNPAQFHPTNTSIPAYPMMFASGGTTDLSTTANAVGIMRNGVAMYSAWARDQVVEYEDTAFYLEAESFDLCGGHSTTEGSYHYHGTAGCLQEQAAVAAGTSASEHSALLGWAYDGFPIYGQLGPDGVEMKMCGLDGADSTACLDVCSGYEALLPDVDDFAYRYYTSCGFDESFFPFTTNCFRGCCPDGITCSEKVDACGDSPENGYTADYTPGLTTSLDEQYDTDLISGDDTDYIGSSSAIDCTLYMGASSGTTVSVSSSVLVTPAPSAPVATTAPITPPTPAPVPDPTPAPITPVPTTSPINPPTPAPINAPTTAPTTPPTPAPINPPTPQPISPPTPSAVTTSSPVADPTPAPITPAPTTSPVNPPTPAPINPPTDAPITPPTPAPINPPTLAPISPPTPAPVTTSSPMPKPTPAPITPAPTTAPITPPTPNPVAISAPIPDPAPSPITSTTSSMDLLSSAPVTAASPPTAEIFPVPAATTSPVSVPTPTPVAAETIPEPTEPATPAPMAVQPPVSTGPAATPAPVASLPTVTDEPTSPDTEPVASSAPVASATLSPVSKSGSDPSSNEYDDDSGYVEVGSLTTVSTAATAYDTLTGEDGYPGCGTDGCLPSLAHDGDSSDIESRWSCSKDIVPYQGQCEITFTFGEPMDLKDVQVAFYKGEERTRWLKIRINGDIIGTFESYSGSVFNSFGIEETEVESVTMESVGIDEDEWVALLEVRFLVEP